MNRKKFLGLLGLAAATPILAKGLETEKVEPALKATEIKELEPIFNTSEGNITVGNFEGDVITSNATGIVHVSSIASWHDPVEGFKVYRTTFQSPAFEFSAIPYEVSIEPNGRITQTSNGSHK